MLTDKSTGIIIAIHQMKLLTIDNQIIRLDEKETASGRESE